MTYVPLSLTDLALSSVLLVASGALSLALRLGLEKSIAVAAGRMVIQLAIVALLLKFVFEVNSPAWTLLFAAIMFAGAVYETVSRQKRRFPGWQTYILGAGPQFFVGLLATLIATAAVIGGDPWYAPRYILPILGMMLGNTMSGVSLVLDTILDGAARDRAAIEAQLALGAGRFDAMSQVMRRGFKTGLMPILSSMAATGIVALPGMMTGQILAGVNPVDAAKYQVMILLLISGATALGVLAAGLGAVLLLTDDRHRLRLDRLQDTNS
jgi:putative ABC transport system permease protein